MPAILKDKFHLNEGYAGMWATVPAQVLSMIGGVIGGFFADRWLRRTNRGRIYVSAIGMLCIVPAIFGVGNADTLTIAIGFLMLFGLGWGFFDGNNMPILSQIVSRPHASDWVWNHEFRQHQLRRFGGLRIRSPARSESRTESDIWSVCRSSSPLGGSGTPHSTAGGVEVTAERPREKSSITRQIPEELVTEAVEHLRRKDRTMRRITRRTDRSPWS